MRRLEEHFINQAINIINKHKYIIDELNTYEEILNNNKKVLLDLQSELEEISGADIDDQQKQKELNSLLESYDTEMDKLNEKIAPFVTEMEQIKKETNILYSAIKNKHAEYTDEELQEQIAIQIKEKESN